MSVPLAIIIPAYKPQFFEKAFSSVLSQTNQNFSLYIGNDGQDYPFEEIINKYNTSISVTYKKFTNNIGSKSLVKQWQRCIELSQNEEWIWLFSDDDIMPVDAVARFYTEISSHPNYDVYRFPLAIINEKDKITTPAPPLPNPTSNIDYLCMKLQGNITTAFCEFIFRRSTIRGNGGFIEFPLAWCSDDASVFCFSKRTGIRHLNGSPVLWRNASGVNISNSIQFDDKKRRATLQFISFLKKNAPSLFIDKNTRKIIHTYLATILFTSLDGRTPFVQLITFCASLSKRTSILFGFKTFIRACRTLIARRIRKYLCV